MPPVPILILSWRRPERTARVLEAVRQYRPDRLYLACDGWGPGTPEAVVRQIEATRELLDREPGWPCEVQRLYFDENLGGPVAVPRALDWFFAACAEGIVLEDDCLPSPEFFLYCEQLLERYRDDPRVMCISGDNSPGAALGGGASYGFIRWPLIWGWATWRSAWERFDATLDGAAGLQEADWAGLLPDQVARRVARDRLGELRAGTRRGWDHTWALSMLAEGGLSIHPRVNLVENIGFGAGATHTVERAPGRDAPVRPILPLHHPSTVEVDESADRVVFDVALGGTEERRRVAWEATVRGRLRVLLHRAAGRFLPAVIRQRRDRATPAWLR